MASQDLKHRPKTDQSPSSTTTTSPAVKQSSTGRRGLYSLAVAVGVPLSITLVDIFYFGSTRRLHKPFYFPPLWALHLACLATASLLGLSAWLVWAEGGFHRRPSALILYLAQLALGLGWYPVVFGAGAPWAGLLVCGGLIGCIVGCVWAFKNTNRVAGDLAKMGLACAVVVSIVNVRLVYK